MTINTWIKNTSSLLRNSGIPTAQLDTELIAAHALSNKRTWLLAHGDEDFPDTTRSTADELVQKRSLRVPLAYLIGEKEFYGRVFRVNPATLIPRPETEALIELAKKHHLRGRLLDVGTGSGCLGITLALETGMELWASDLSEDALDVAVANAAKLGVRGKFALSHLIDRWKKYQFTVIAANLPYVDETWDRSPETDHEPAMALFAPEDGLRLIKELIDDAPAVLEDRGYLLLEADPEQHPEITGYAGSRFELIDVLDYGLLFRKK